MPNSPNISALELNMQPSSNQLAQKLVEQVSKGLKLKLKKVVKHQRHQHTSNFQASNQPSKLGSRKSSVASGAQRGPSGETRQKRESSNSHQSELFSEALRKSKYFVQWKDHFVKNYMDDDQAN